MIIAYDLIISAYGFWLPNDPRGSWSEFVGSWELLKFGPSTKTTERRSLAHDRHDVEQRRAAKTALKYPPVRFDHRNRSAIGDGFGRASAEGNYLIYACCIGYDHAHLVIARHDRDLAIIAGHLKSHATRAMLDADAHPLCMFVGKRGTPPTPWSEGCWKVFIDDTDQLGSAIRYVQRHPEKENLPAQHWPFVASTVA